MGNPHFQDKNNKLMSDWRGLLLSNIIQESGYRIAGLGVGVVAQPITHTQPGPC